MRVIRFKRPSSPFWEIAFNEEHLEAKLNGEMATTIIWPEKPWYARLWRRLFLIGIIIVSGCDQKSLDNHIAIDIKIGQVWEEVEIRDDNPFHGDMSWLNSKYIILDLKRNNKGELYVKYKNKHWEEHEYVSGDVENFLWNKRLYEDIK